MGSKYRRCKHLYWPSTRFQTCNSAPDLSPAPARSDPSRTSDHHRTQQAHCWNQRKPAFSLRIARRHGETLRKFLDDWRWRIAYLTLQNEESRDMVLRVLGPSDYGSNHVDWSTEEYPVGEILGGKPGLWFQSSDNEWQRARRQRIHGRSLIQVNEWVKKIKKRLYRTLFIKTFKNLS